MSEPENDRRPPKRAREEDSNPMELNLEELTRDEEFWFEDGNIVLVAGNIAFKVFKGLLAAQSKVLGDMVAAGDPGAGQMLEGCPVVRLFDDSPLEVRYLLRVLVPKGDIMFYPDPDADWNYDYHEILALARLSHKYEIETIERQAIRCLETFFATWFHDWERRSPPFNFYDNSWAIGAVVVARLTNNTDILPLALYHCALLGGEVIDGFTRKDGTVEHLEPTDLKRCIDAYGYLRAETPQVFDRIFTGPPSRACQSRAICQANVQAIRESLDAETDVDALYVTDLAIDVWVMDHPLCDTCTSALKKRNRTERRTIWKGIPSILNLPSEIDTMDV